MIPKLGLFYISNWPDQTRGENVNQVDCSVLSLLLGIRTHFCFSCLGTEMKVVLIFGTGSGAYVVIDNRTKAGDNTRETSSNDGNLLFIL